MTAADLSKKVLQTIKEQRIQPTARWKFLLKDSVIWAVFGVAVVIGSLAVAVMIFIVANERVFEILPMTWAKKAFIILPYFWLIILAAFVFISYINLKHTKVGYKISPYLIVVASVVASLIFGAILYFTGIAGQVEKVAYEQFPLYKKMMRQQTKFLVEPEQGRLAGVILEIKIPQEMRVEDFNGKAWKIYYTNQALIPPNFQEKCREFLPDACDLPIFQIQIGQRVGIMGEQISNNEFNAVKIRPMFEIEKMPQPQRLHMR
jgi:hypothetical protein